VSVSGPGAGRWPSIRLRFLLREIDERVGHDAGDMPLLSVSIHRGVLPRSEMTDRESRADDFATYKRVARGDIVVNRMRAFEGGAGISLVDGMASSDYAVLRAGPRLDARYFHHLIRSRWFVGEMIARLRGIGNIEVGNVRTPRINVEDLGDIRIGLPSRREQRRIADYLDAETAQIDAVVERRRQLVALSSARRFEAARACFRGEGAASGRLHWVPGLPVGWPVIHLRWLATCLDGRRIPVNREDRGSMQGDIPYWGANGIVDHVDAALFDEPLVLLGEDGAPFFDRDKPKAFFVDTPVWVNNHIHILRAHGIRPRFLAHYLNLVDYAEFVGGSTRDKLTQDDMGSIPVPVPDLAEQEHIEQEISVSQRMADRFEAATEHQIALLLERRQALITSVVTGQHDIPDLAA
jgi:type I restriction enzyme S subunit